MKVLILILFLFSCSPEENNQFSENKSETNSSIKKIKLNGADSIIYTDSKKENSTTVSAFAQKKAYAKNVIGLSIEKEITTIDFITEGMKEDESYEVERIVKLTESTGYASVNNANYIFDVLSGDAKRLHKPVLIANVPINESPIQKYKDLYYFKNYEGFWSAEVVDGKFSNFSKVGNAYFFEINEIGILHYNTGQEFFVKDLNGVLNNGEVFTFKTGEYTNGRVYSSISGNVFLSEDEPSFLVFNNAGLLVELHTMTESGVEVEEITNTRYFRLDSLADAFSHRREYCKRIPNTEKYALFCYVSKEKYKEDTGTDDLTAGGHGSVSNLFINGDILANIPLYGSLRFSHTSACENYGDCGANNNHTYFGFYTIDAFDMWGNYFVACGEEMVEYSSPIELLGKRCVLYDVRTRKLKSELNEIVDNNTFTVDHVLFEDDGDILFYGSDFGSTEKKFKLSTHNAGTWSALQDTTVDFDQYIDKILRF